MICADFKIINYLLGQQVSFAYKTAEPTQHREKKGWPIREEIVVGTKNVINELLDNRDQVGPNQTICQDIKPR